jgi:hypothetical protein
VCTAPLAPTAPGFVSRFARFATRTEGALCLVTYEEWQHLSGTASGRISSAWFRARSDTPHGVEWLHVHETWLPDSHDLV